MFSKTEQVRENPYGLFLDIFGAPIGAISSRKLMRDTTMIIRGMMALGLVWLCMGHNLTQNTKGEHDARQAVLTRLADMRQDLHQARAEHPVDVAAVSRDAAIQVAGLAADNLANAMRNAIATPAQAAEKN